MQSKLEVYPDQVVQVRQPIFHFNKPGYTEGALDIKLNWLKIDVEDISHEESCENQGSIFVLNSEINIKSR